MPKKGPKPADFLGDPLAIISGFPNNVDRSSVYLEHPLFCLFWGFFALFCDFLRFLFQRSHKKPSNETLNEIYSISFIVSLSINKFIDNKDARNPQKTQKRGPHGSWVFTHVLELWAQSLFGERCLSEASLDLRSYYVNQHYGISFEIHGPQTRYKEGSQKRP